MICLTCDIHHTSLQTGNQLACPITEAEVANRFAGLLEQAGVKATFFVTGKCFEEEWPEVIKFCANPLISIQGHNYNCFTPPLLHRVWKKLTGNYNGPACIENRDIQRTVEIIAEKTGKRITCWRNHMYMHGPNTDKLLLKHGIKLCSDGVDISYSKPLIKPSGIYHFPLNIIPDHEHIYHAERTPEWVAWWQKRYNWSDDFGSESYPIEQWTELVLEGLRKNEAAGKISNMIIHPITMYLSDQFASFKKILSYLAAKECVHLADLAP